MDYVIGVDCGGTNTTAIAYNLDGTPIKTTVTGPANLMVDDSRALNNVRNALRKLLASVDGTCQAITVGLAGLRAYQFKERFRQQLNLPTENIQLINDAQLALIAKLHGQDGLVVIAGTGAIVIGTADQRQFSAGGWGHLLGDEGSGYHLSLLAVQQVTMEADDRQATAFGQALLAHLNLRSVFELIDHFYQWDKARVAKLAPFVLAQAKAGDPTAIGIVKKSAQGLATKIIQARRKGDWSDTDTVKIAVTGSVLEKNTYYRDILKQAVMAAGLPFTYLPITPTVSNAIAAVYDYQD